MRTQIWIQRLILKQPVYSSTFDEQIENETNRKYLMKYTELIPVYIFMYMIYAHLLTSNIFF